MKDYSDYSINKDIFFSGAERKYEILVHFNDVGESTLEQDKELYQYSYQDIQQILMDNTKLTNVSETISRFWDMFIVDALNGNFDRHGGNWGFIKKNNQYVISPYWGMIEQLPEGIFSGIPGIDLEHRKEQYYRVNLTPSFIEMRTPSPSREDLWELLEEVGLDYYDRFEWMLRAGKALW